MKKYYLAGKVNGRKWTVAKPIKTVTFIASDGSNHSEHDFGFGYFCFDNNYEAMRETIKEYCLDEIKECDGLIAYLDEPTSFGSIAEIAYASANGKHSFVIINDQTRIDEFTFYSPFYDVYWFVCQFPNVVVREVKTEKEATQAIRSYTLIASPAERLLYDELLRHEIDVTPQFNIGAYFLDFAVPEKKIAIEVDGHDFRKTKEQRAHDAKRDRYLQSLDWKVFRYTGSEVYQTLDMCRDEILSFCKG